MPQQSEMSDVIRRRLDAGPISVASLVTEMRTRWGSKHPPAEVHLFVSEVIRCLLRQDEVKLGAVQGSGFVSWAMEPWDAADRLEKELGALSCFLEDADGYVLQKVTA